MREMRDAASNNYRRMPFFHPRELLVLTLDVFVLHFISYCFVSFRWRFHVTAVRGGGHLLQHLPARTGRVLRRPTLLGRLPLGDRLPSESESLVRTRQMRPIIHSFSFTTAFVAGEDGYSVWRMYVGTAR